MKRAFLTSALAIAAAFPQLAWSQSRNCGERGPIVERLAASYGEHRQSMGLNTNNGILEVFASPETGTWTILITMPSGLTCLMAAGEHWESNPGEAIQSKQGA